VSKLKKLIGERVYKVSLTVRRKSSPSPDSGGGGGELVKNLGL